MRFGDLGEARIPPEHQRRIMHATLHIGGGLVMVSDSMPGTAAPRDSNGHVSVDFDDPDDLARRFEALSEGGKVTMPLHAFWGAKFGMLTDRFGIRWMFNCDLKKR